MNTCMSGLDTASPPFPPPPVLKSFGLTHVRYPAGGPIGPLMALASLAPQFIMCAYATVIITRRELTFVNACAAQLANEGLNWFLKRLFRIPRPVSAAQLGDGGTGYGMPSSHSQFMGFFAAFFLLHFYAHRPYQPRRPITVVSIVRRVEHYASLAFVALLSAMTPFSRWYLGYHTAPQVLVGLSLGLFIGCIYWYLTEKLACHPIILPFDTGLRPKYLFVPPPPRALIRHDSNVSATLGHLAMAGQSRSASISSAGSVQSLVSAPADIPTPRDPGSPTASVASDTHSPRPPDERGLFEDPFRPSTRSTRPQRPSLSTSPKGSNRVLDEALVSHISGASSQVGSLADLAAVPEPMPRRKRPRTRYPFPALRQLILDHPIAIALRLRDSYNLRHDGGLEADYGHWRVEYEKRRAWEWDDRDAEDIRPQNRPEESTPGSHHHRTHHTHHRPHHSSHNSSRIPSRPGTHPPLRNHSPYPEDSGSYSKASPTFHTPSGTPRGSHAYAPGSAYTRALAEKLTHRRHAPSPSSTPPISRTPDPWVPTLSRRTSVQNTARESSRPATETAASLPIRSEHVSAPTLARPAGGVADEIPTANLNQAGTGRRVTASSLSTTPAPTTMSWSELPREEQETHVAWMLRSLRLADQCGPTTTAFCVGSLLRPRAPQAGEALATGFSRELEGNTHAEQCVLDKLAASLAGAEPPTGPVQDLECDLYTTMEPCSERLSGAVPCMQRILAFNASLPTLSAADLTRLGVPHREGAYRLRITRVLQGVSEPEDFVQCVGARTLRDAGIEVLTVRPLRPLTTSEGEDYAWLEKECLRVAKFGHPDQPVAQPGAESLWKTSH